MWRWRWETWTNQTKWNMNSMWAVVDCSIKCYIKWRANRMNAYIKRVKNNNKQNKPVDSFAIHLYTTFYLCSMCCCLLFLLPLSHLIFNIYWFVFFLSFFVDIQMLTRTIESFNFVMIFDFQYYFFQQWTSNDALLVIQTVLFEFQMHLFK